MSIDLDLDLMILGFDASFLPYLTLPYLCGNGNGNGSGVGG